MQPKTAPLLASLLLTVSATVSALGPPPELKLIDLKGRPQSLSQYRGKIVVLNFWATWCANCKTDIPMLVEEQDRYRDRGVIVIGASMDDATTVKKVPAFVKQEKINYPVWVGATLDQLQQLGLSQAIPATAFFDSEGNMVGRVMGVIHKDDFEHRIEWLLGNHQGTAPEALVDNVNPK